MKTIEFPLLSILSLCVLIFFGLQGNVDLYSWEIGASITRDEVRLTVDPVFAVWIPQSLTRTLGCNGLAYGNVMMLNEQLQETKHGDYLLAHESNHVEQFHALSWYIYIAQFLVDIEPPEDMITDWNDPSQCDRVMWLPPIDWVNQWHFAKLSATRIK